MSQHNLADQEQNMTLKAARVLDNHAEEIKSDLYKVKPAMAVETVNAVTIEDDQENANQQCSNEPLSVDKPTSKKWVWLLFTLVLAASTIELFIFIQATIKSMDWLAGVWLLIGAGFAIMTIKWVVKEYQGLKQLKQQSELRTQSKNIADTDIIGRAEQHCLKVADLLPIQCQPFITQWRKSIAAHHNDQEILNLFEHKVIAKVDNMAMQQITKNATAASVMIAVSPFALVDMLIVLWRNILMLDQVSKIYGLQLGYWARVKLIKSIFHTMLFAGAAEILSDAGNYALGTSITGKLSTRVAQGLGAGILTARVGLKAIHQSRPLPYLSVQKPGLNEISKQLLVDLQKQIS